MDYMDLISRRFDDRFIKLAYPMIISEETSQKDNPNLGETTKSDDCENFMKATEKEIKYLTTEDVWKILPKSSLPTSSHIIRLTRSFKRKINPFGELIKHKASLCVHDSMKQEEVYFHNTFVPVINWSIVRLIIIMAEISGWE